MIHPVRLRMVSGLDPVQAFIEAGAGVRWSLLGAKWRNLSGLALAPPTSPIWERIEL